MEQEMAACRYFINRMMTFPLDKVNQRKEWNTICKIAHNNFPHNIIKEPKTRMEHNITTTETKGQHKKCATFTYYSPQIRKVTNLFKHTEIKIEFRRNNNIQLVRTKKNNGKEHYNRSGIYTLTCKTCKHK
jgi:hypothetical protein